MMKHFVFAVAGIAVAAAVGAVGLKTAHAGDMPIADMHCHLNPESSPEDLLSWMDAAGVKWCATGVLGSKFGARKTRLKFAEVMGDRYIPFGGQSDLNAIYVTSQDVSAQNDAENPKFKKIFSLLKKDFEEGRIRGIGELFLNTSTTNKYAKMRRKADINSPAMKALFALSNEHNGVITFHVEWDSDTVEQIDDLMSANPSARMILAHCGSNTGPKDVKPLFEKYPNFFCDLSARSVPKIPAKAFVHKPEKKVFGPDGIVSGWKDLIEEMPDRFLVGSDVYDGAKYAKAIKVIRKGLLGNLSPETVEKVAYKNAVKLFGLQ